ncbi:MAG: hypothetical protein H8D45_01385 [Bacteroidetes bacterium]|nr:hypothetical protein [Bacteroidota bacterium]
MKKSFLVILFTLLISSFGNSQNKYPYWSLDVTGGVIYPIGEGMITDENFHPYIPGAVDYFGNVYSISGGFGVDMLLHFDPSWAVFCNGTYNILTTKAPYKSTANNSFFELTIGPRYYFSQKNPKVFGEVGSGLYNYYMGPYSEEYTINRSPAPDTTILIEHDITTMTRDLGINVGTGIEFSLGFLPATFVAKAKYHFIFTNPLEELIIGDSKIVQNKWGVKKNTSYVSFYAGINANF